MPRLRTRIPEPTAAEAVKASGLDHEGLPDLSVSAMRKRAFNYRYVPWEYRGPLFSDEEKRRKKVSRVGGWRAIAGLAVRMKE